MIPSGFPMAADIEEEILVALRRITRAIDIHSRYLASTFGLTGPQLVCLRVLGRLESTTPGTLAKQVDLSQATVTGIVDRLTARQLVARSRSENDRRNVTVAITDAGRALLAEAPSALQEKFAQRLAGLSNEEREFLLLSLKKIVRMMDGEDLDAAPILSTDPEAPAEIGVPIETESDDAAPRAALSSKPDLVN